MIQQSLIYIYPTLDEVEAAGKHLSNRHFPINQISIVTQNIETVQHHGFIAVDDFGKQSVTSTARMSSFLELLVGVTFIWLPGNDPVFAAGPFAATLRSELESGAECTKVDKLLNVLMIWGVSNENIMEYAAMIRQGKYLLAANCDETWVCQARMILGNATND